MGRVYRFLGLDASACILAADAAGRAARCSTPPTSPTAPTTSSASTTCATTWPGPRASCVQRGHAYAIVDEVDSILIDEARTPLIISGPADQPTKWYAEFAEHRRAGCDRTSTTRSTRRSAPSASSSPASSRVEDYLGIDNLYESGQHPAGRLPQQRDQGQGAVQARQGLRRHQRRGAHRRRAHRPHAAGRRYNEGMHQAIEAKEGVEIRARTRRSPRSPCRTTSGCTTSSAGMTGTAHDRGRRSSAQIYKLGVVPIPTNMPMIRADQPDLVYKQRGRQVRRGRRGHRRAARAGPADPGRHGERGEVASTCPTS